MCIPPIAHQTPELISQSGAVITFTEKVKGLIQWI